MHPELTQMPHLNTLFSVLIDNRFATQTELSALLEQAKKLHAPSGTLRREMESRIAKFHLAVKHLETEIPGFSDNLNKELELIGTSSIVPEKEDAPSPAGHVPEQTSEKVFTFHEINKLMEDHSVNLFEAVPGHLLPKESPKDYVRFQLCRFIDAASTRGASDFFIQSRKNGKDGTVRMEIQFKLAGKCVTQDKTDYAIFSNVSPTPEHKFFRTCMSRFVEMSNISEVKSIEQGGSFSLNYRGKNYDFRLSQLPVQSFKDATPSLCIRITTNADEYTLEKIQAESFIMRKLERAIDMKAGGAIILTGPTGAGKSSTIYGMINRLDGEATRIISVERPIESNSSIMQQTEEDLKLKDVGLRYTMSDALNAFMRQAGDLYLVGEMTSGEQSQLTLNLANRGAALVTTFHVNSTTDAIVRLLQEGVPRNVVGSAVRFISAQRLCPRLCPHCSVPHEKHDLFINLCAQPFIRSKKSYEVNIKKVLEENDIADSNDIVASLYSSSCDFLSTRERTKIAEMVLEDSLAYNKAIQSGSLIPFFLEKTKDYPMPEERAVYEDILSSKSISRKRNPNGCKKCGGSGYASRMYPIWEILEIDTSIKKFIQNKDLPIQTLTDYLRDKGFLFLRDYALLSVLRGCVEYEEVMSIVGE